MSAPVETGGSGRRVDVTVGGDVDSDSGRSFSVGQLQLALRTAQAAASGSVPPGQGVPATDGPRETKDSRSKATTVLDGDRSLRSMTRLVAAAARVLGGQNLGVLLAARKSRRAVAASAGTAKADGVWDVSRPSSTSSPIVLRRWAAFTALVMLLVVGAVTVTGRVVAMIHPSPVVVAATPRVSDLQFAGAAQAVALDYLSWDTAAPRALRTAALNRWGFGRAMNDGWDGSGQLGAENAVPVAVLRSADDQAVVTLQVRAVPASQVESTNPGTNDSTKPGVGSARWLTVAVPVALRGPQLVVTAPPALIGSPPTQALGLAVRTAADEDTNAGRATAETVGKLIAAYGSGDLEFVRGPGSTSTGLAGMVTAGQVQSWRMAKTAPGDDRPVRSGDVTVLWTLPGGAGQLRSTYRIELAQRENRWLLQQITPAMEVSL